MGETLTIRNQPLLSRSVPEGELLGFVSALTGLLGAEQTGVLTEIWLDELASMETMPEPTSTQWRLVTLGAWVRLAQHLLMFGSTDWVVSACSRLAICGSSVRMAEQADCTATNHPLSGGRYQGMNE